MLTPGLNLKRITEEEIGPEASTDLAVWLFFQMAAGHIALPILTATFLFSKTVTKIPELIVVCMTWILSAVFSTLLFYVGEHTGPEPGKGLCIAQASLIGATPPMTCTAIILLAAYVWKTYDDPDMGVDLHPGTRKGILEKIMLHLSPFIMLGVFVAIGVNIALQHPDRVNRSQEYFYCSLDWPPFTIAVSVISTLLCLVALGIEIYVLITATRYWGLLRRGGHLTNESIGLALRVITFTCFLLASTIINLASIWVTIGVFPDLLSASVGMCLFLLFVSQQEVLYAWAFWRRTPQLVPSYAPHDSLTIQRRRFQGNDSPMPSGSLGSTYTLGTGLSSQASQALPMKDQGSYGSQPQFIQTYSPQMGGVQIIGKPEDAFSRRASSSSSRDARGHRADRTRDTISTWGF